MSEVGYIRGGGGVSLDARRVGRGLAVALVVVLAACAAWQAVAAAVDNAHADRLRNSGVPVQITVTGCSGISSGIGMGVEFYKCRGSYSLAGAAFTGLVHGSRSELTAGQVIPGRVVPSDPTTLTRTGPGATALPSGSVGSYTVAIVLGVLAVLGAAGIAFCYWRSGRRSLSPPQLPAVC